MTAADASHAPVVAPPHLPAVARGDVAGHGLLDGRRVLVVGGGQSNYGQPDPPAGIGMAISVRCAAEGAAVAVSDLRSDGADLVAAEARTYGRTVVTLVGDASDEADTERIVTQATAELGGLDGLVCNVGITAGLGLENTTVEDWDRVQAVNVRSHFLAIKHALPLLPAGGSIVLVSSAAASLPSSMSQPAYAASKAALNGLSLFAAKEAATQRVRVNIVMPSLIDTPLGRLATAVKPDRVNTPIPLGRLGTAWEVAHATTFLLSDLASYITGSTIVVDGGLYTVP